MLTNQKKLLTHFSKGAKPQFHFGQVLSTEVLWQHEGYKCLIFDEFSQLSKALSSSPAHLFLCQSIKQFILISHCCLSLYITYYTEFSSNEAKNDQGMKNSWKQQPGKSNLHSIHKQTFPVSSFSILPILLEAFRSFMFSFPFFPQLTWTSKVHFTDCALLSVWCSWRSNEKIWSTLQI